MEPSKWNPCCGGVSLKQGTKAIAMIDMVTSVATCCFAGFAVIITLLYGDDIKAALDQDKADFPNEADMYDYLGSGLMITVLLLVFFTSLMYYFLAQHLLHGAKQRDEAKITRWIHITTTILFIRIIFNLITLLASETAMMPFFGIIGLVYTGYSLWVVHGFRQELLSEECYTLRQHHHNPGVYKL